MRLWVLKQHRLTNKQLRQECLVLVVVYFLCQVSAVLRSCCFLYLVKGMMDGQGRHSSELGTAEQKLGRTISVRTERGAGLVLSRST